MTFEEIWDIVVKRNQNLQTDKEVTMTVNGFKKALKMAYEQGLKHEEVEITKPPSKAHGDAVETLMNMFGMKK